jgi:hypothetical protein
VKRATGTLSTLRVSTSAAPEIDHGMDEGPGKVGRP